MREGTLLRRTAATAAAAAGAIAIWLFAGGLVQVSASQTPSTTHGGAGARAGIAAFADPQPADLLHPEASATIGGSAGARSSGSSPGSADASAFTDRSSETGIEHPGEGGGSPHRSAGRKGALLVDVSRDLSMTTRPGKGRTVGTVPASSRFYRVPTVAWVQEISGDGRFGRLSVPYDASGRSGWIALRGLERRRTRVTVQVSVSRHEVTVERGDRVIMRMTAAVGTATSPTPRGRFFVTDRVPFPSGGYLGTFAFGLSGIQPRLPTGWSGGDQLAIHGTDDPTSIGRAVSAGCVRVSEAALDRLRPLLRLGTPVVIGR